MRRAAVLTFLVACTLTGLLQAQRAGVMFQGHGAGIGDHSGFVGQGGFGSRFLPQTGLFRRRQGFVPRKPSFPRHGFFPGSALFGFSPNRFFHPNSFGAVVVPYLFSYNEAVWQEEPYSEPAAAQPSPPQMTAPISPKFIEVPEAANSAAAKPLPPAIFILKDGERLETRQFLLTVDDLVVTIGLERRTIPVLMLDISATVTTNRERGIDLRVPADEHEISLGF